MPTNFRYIKALVPIRLFNGALWMEEEDINRITEATFNRPEVQQAITNNELIEVNNNDLPVDVVSPHLKFKGDWDASDNQLPIGRRVGDVFKVIAAGLPGGIPVAVDQLVFFRTLDAFDFLGLTTAELDASQYLFKTTGDWTPVGSLADATPIGAVDGVIGTNGSNSVLSPNSPLLGLGSIAIAYSGGGIQVTGSDVVWSKIIVPDIQLGDNVQDFGIYFLNETAEPEDFSILATGGFPTNSVYGGVVELNPDGFTAYAIANNVVGNSNVGTFASSLVAGDTVYVGFDRANSRLLVKRNAEPTQVGANLIFSGFPVGEGYQICSFISFSSNTVQFAAEDLEFDFSTSDGGMSPVQAMGPVLPPVDAEEGREYRVLANATYNGYKLKNGDIVKFFNGVDDVVITRIPEVSKDDIPPGVLSVGYDVNTQQLVVTRVFANGRTDNVSTLIETAAASGFACITDITPQNIAENVGTKVTTDNGEVLVSCVSGTQNIRVHVLATTGSGALKPSVSVNGNAVTNLVVAEARSLWEGYYDLTITGDTTVTVTHLEGATSSCSVVYEAPPVVNSAVFLGSYPNVGQIEYAAGQTVQVQVGSTNPFVEIEFENSAGTATTAYTETFASTTSKTVTLTIADRGDVTQNLPAKVRIRNATGTWSAWYLTNSAGSTDHVHTVALNDTRPSVVFGTVVYPGSQQAIKAAETALLPVTYNNCSSVAFSSAGSECFFDNAVAMTDQNVGISFGGQGTYNISTNNVTATVQRAVNATSAVFNTLVWIADVEPVITITTPAARLRSGVTAQNHTITIHSDQRTVSPVSLDIDKGSWTGSWITANNGLTWTRTLQISDATPKGTGTFANLSITSLSGMVVSTITSGDQYTVGGFVQRVITFAAFTNESDIGTYVSDTSKLRATNLSKGDSGTLNTIFEQSLVAQVGAGANPSKYAITSPLGVLNTQGRYVYNRDQDNVNANTSGTMQWEIEELV